MLSIYDEKRLHVDFLSSLSHESATAYHIYCREKKKLLASFRRD